mgnify:CR=1 FL=1
MMWSNKSIRRLKDKNHKNLRRFKSKESNNKGIFKNSLLMKDTKLCTVSLRKIEVLAFLYRIANYKFYA